ncbi:MAG TPA: SDR family NAD(P)-dependent oxidoreductase [Candidatus Limnocylindrales bacterium]|nr:SDR family NAD(P)-dependent oxidoreductase [Candidatus Limnocylindrales bacterium]
MGVLSGARVLVTGADGFIGSHLVERLVAEGANVRAFCLYTSEGSVGWLSDLPPTDRARLDIRLGDVRDRRLVEDAVDGVDVVFHLAALIAIPYSYRAGQSFVETNVMGTLNVLEALRDAPRLLVHTSTSEVYGTPETLPITERHPLNAQSPYAASKLAADQLVLAYHRSFGIPAVVLRPFNTYGPRQSQRAVLPTMLAQLLAGRREIRLGRLDTSRDLTFVADTVDGFVRAATTPAAIGETIQLGTGRAETIGRLFEIARDIVGTHAEAVADPERMRPDASEVLALRSDPTRAAEVLGWRATTSLEDGIRATVDWLRGRPLPDEVERVRV